MSILLISPPCSTAVTGPSAALPALQAFLKRRGIHVAVKDFNIEFVHHVLAHWESFRSQLHNELERRREESFSEETSRYYGRIQYGLAPVVRSLGNAIKHKDYSNVEAFVKILYDTLNCFYCDDTLNHNRHMFLTPDEMDSLVARLSEDRFFSDFIASRLPATDIKLIGLTLLSESQLPYGLAITRLLRTAFPKARIVAGGPYFTEVAEAKECSGYFLRFFDYLCLHEGETALADIYDAIVGTGEVNHTNVISQENPYGGKFLTEPIDCLPAPDFEGLPLDLYLTSDLSLPYYASKGCTWGQCKFCSLVANQYREKGIEFVIQDIREIIENTGIRHFQFVDENIPPQRLRNIASALLSTAINIRWFAQIRFDKDLDLRTLDLMKKSGCYAIEFGLESGSPRILKEIRKGITLPMVERVLLDCAQAGLEVILNCMIGFPGETLENAQETTAFLNDLTKRNTLLHVSCNTQVVKIYRSSRYIVEDCLSYRNHPFSTIVEWNNPPWVQDFVEQFNDHFLLSAKNSASVCASNLDGPSLKKPDDYYIELSKSCVYLGEVLYNFQNDLVTESPENYMVLLHNTRTPEIYLLNEPMDFIIRYLAQGRIRLTELKKAFFQFFEGFDRDDQLRSLTSGLIFLNEKAGIIIC